MKQEVTIPLPGTATTKYDVEIDPIRAHMVGLVISYISESTWSLSISLGGLIASKTGYFYDEFDYFIKNKRSVVAA